MLGNPPDTFLRSKIRIPRAPQGTIARPRLEALRHQVLGVRLVTLTAPGGFGKSTLAATWVAQWQDEGHRCAWLSLTQDDDEPARFLFSLVQALQPLGVGEAAQTLLQGRALAAPRAVVSLLLNDLEAFEGEAFLVLDDHQWLQAPEIHEALAFFITHAPPHFHLVITSRVVPPLPLARLRAHGQWLDVDAATLRFDEEETRRFLTAACTQIPSAKQVARLHASTEGWAAALRLVALGHSLNRTIDTADTQGSSSVFATLFEDLLQNLPPATVRFMAQTAALERIHLDLCEAVCQEDPDRSGHIAHLQQYHLLIDSGDGASPWLRYHQLLREHLQGSVVPRLGIDLRLVHRRAAQWFADQNQWTDAVRHALQAGDTQQAVQWLALCGKKLVTSGDLLTLLGWRRQFPPELLATQPQVQLAIAWGLALAIRFDEAEPLLQHIENQARTVLQGQALHDTLGECLAIRAVIVALQDDSVQAHERVRQWEAGCHSGDPFTHNAVSNVMRYVHWKSGQLVQAYEQPWLASEPGQEQQIAFSTVYRHTLLGSIELQKTRLDLAERHARQAMRCAQEHGETHSVSATLAAPLLATVHYLQDRPEQAEQTLLPLLPLIDTTAMLESVLQAYQVLVSTARLQGRPAQAFEYLERAEAIGYNRGWDRLVANMLLERVRLLIAEYRFEEASATTIRLRRLAAQASATPPSARSDLLVLRDIALARLALADQRIDEARSAFAALLQDAQDTAQDLRALQLGTCLAIAHMAAGDQHACFDRLGTTLQGVQKSGAVRSLLDEDGELQKLLVPFLVSEACDEQLTEFVRSLLAQSNADNPREPSPDAVLTARECDILALVSQGLSNKEISRRLDISAETVKTHLKNTFEKLGVQRRAQAVLIAQSLDLIPST